MRDAAELVGGVTPLGLLPADVRVERLAGDVLHHQDGAVDARREVVHAADVRVADGPRVQELLPERLVVAGHARLFADDLQRDGLLRRAVVREEDLTHAPFAEALANLVPVVDDGSAGDRRRMRARGLVHRVNRGRRTRRRRLILAGGDGRWGHFSIQPKQTSRGSLPPSHHPSSRATMRAWRRTRCCVSSSAWRGGSASRCASRRSTRRRRGGAGSARCGASRWCSWTRTRRPSTRSECSAKRSRGSTSNLVHPAAAAGTHSPVDLTLHRRPRSSPSLPRRCSRREDAGSRREDAGSRREDAGSRGADRCSRRADTFSRHADRCSRRADPCSRGAERCSRRADTFSRGWGRVLSA